MTQTQTRMTPVIGRIPQVPLSDSK
jgi:hypothetical protein